MKLSPEEREALVVFITENPDLHETFEARHYRTDGNVQITVDHLTVLLHRWLYEKLIGEPAPPYLLPDCSEGKRCQNPYHRKPATAPVFAMPRPKRSRATGEGMSAPELNRAKTHCPYDHEYTPENTYVWYEKDGTRHRKCKTCTIRRARAQHRAEAKARQERKA